MAIYAVDFDNTLAVTRFPEIVEPKRKIVAAVKMLKAKRPQSHSLDEPGRA